MIIAHKETERYSNIKGEEEFVHVTILKIKVKEISQKDIEEFFDFELVDNDSEDNYFNWGISTDWEGSLYSIDVEKFCDGLKNWIESETQRDEDDQSYFIDLAKKLEINMLNYTDYDFYFEEDKKNGEN